MTWTNVTVSAALANVTSAAGNNTGILGCGNGDGDVTWTGVTVTTALTNVTSTSGRYVGVLGTGSEQCTWANVTVSAECTDGLHRQDDGGAVDGRCRRARRFDA